MHLISGSKASVSIVYVPYDGGEGSAGGDMSYSFHVSSASNSS